MQTGSKFSVRCKQAWTAYETHYLTFKELEWIMMQYEIEEHKAGNIHTLHPLPNIPDHPTESQRRDYQIADGLNYEAGKRLEKIAAFKSWAAEVDPDDPPSDLDLAKCDDWWVYLKTGKATDDISKHICDPVLPPTEEPQPAAELAEEDIPF